MLTLSRKKKVKWHMTLPWRNKSRIFGPIIFTDIYIFFCCLFYSPVEHITRFIWSCHFRKKVMWDYVMKSIISGELKLNMKENHDVIFCFMFVCYLIEKNAKEEKQPWNQIFYINTDIISFSDWQYWTMVYWETEQQQ